MISNERLEQLFLYWLNHFTVNGYKHYEEDSSETIQEIYYDDILDKIIEEIPDPTEEVVKRINQMF